jgi:predicted phage tail protein
MRRKVILGGQLAQRYGREHWFDIATPGEAFRALAANFPTFTADFMKLAEHYCLIIDKTPAGDVSRLGQPFSQSIRIIPTIRGGKRQGVIQLIAAAIIITATLYFAPPAAPGVAATLLGSEIAFSAAIAIGTSLAIQGTTQLLSKQPKAPSPYESTANNPSYAFNGAVNTTAQGQPVPIGYGRLIVGSAVISTGITADDFTG